MEVYRALQKDDFPLALAFLQIHVGWWEGTQNEIPGHGTKN